MTPKQITLIAGLCLISIFVTQTYLVFEYFQTTKVALTREADDILLNAFRADLTRRTNNFQQKIGANQTIVPPAPSSKNTYSVDMSKTNSTQKNVVGLLDLAIHKFVSKTVPLDIGRLDSTTGTMLLTRDIHSEYTVRLINSGNDKVLQNSKKELPTSLFLIQSKYLNIDPENGSALQLILVNPFGIIIKRMSLMLGSSLILAIICLLAFVVLIRILAKQKQLVAFKNEFLGTIAHELKRPVASLSFNLDCLTMPANDPEQRLMLLNKSINATTELNDTISMIVQLTKLEEGLLVLNKESIDLHPVLEDLRERFVNSAAKTVDIQTVYETTGIQVNADRQLLQHCLANLIDNAIKYSESEVRIVIRVSKTPQSVCIAVTDNGLGIPPEKLALIFEKYSRVHTDSKKINGFGIGLNYVKTIVEKHRGTVEVSSQPGAGSEFRVLIPA